MKKPKYASGGEIKPVQDITQLYPDMLNFVLQQAQQQVYDEPSRGPRQSIRRRSTDLSQQIPQGIKKQDILQAGKTPQRNEESQENEDLLKVDTNEEQVEDKDFLSEFLGGSKRTLRGRRTNPSAPINMSSGDKVSADVLQSHLEKQGLPSHVASGIIGNLYAESSLNTGAVNPQSGAIGLGQWLGPRQKALKAFAAKDKRDITDPTLQADFLVSELRGTEKKAYQELLKTHTPQEAAMSFAKYYERPSEQELNSSASKRIEVANSVSNNSNMKKRTKKNLDEYALGGGIGGASPWGSIIGGGAQILQALLNGPTENSQQPIVNIKQTRAMTNPYQFAKGGIVVTNHAYGDNEGLTDAQIKALSQFIPYPSSQPEIPAPVAPIEQPDDSFYSQNTDGSFAINYDKINKQRTAGSGYIGDNYSHNTNRAYGYEGLYGNRDYISTYATGGTIPGMQGVEVEGDEAAQLPNGQVMQFQGPDHEDGGIPVNLPEGTKIYSDRLEIDGKTMQQRKLAREKSIAKMNKMLERSVDPFSKNAVQRVMDINQVQDAQDMQLQEAAKSIYQAPIGPQQGAPQAAMGGYMRKYADGGTIFDPLAGYQTFNGQSDITVPYAPNYLAPLQGAAPGFTLDPAKSAMPIANTTASIPVTNSGSGYNPNNYSTDTNTIGNTIGIAGNLFGAIAPIINTRNNAAATKPNKNFYQNFGKDALATNDAAQTYVNGQRANALTDLNTQKNAARLRARNSSRSIQGITALDAVADMGADKGSNDIYNTFAQQMIGLLGQRTGLENQRDQFVMSGAKQADLENRQDVDAYYSNLGRDFQSLASGIQNTGKELNQIQANNDLLSFINMQGEHVQIQRNKRTGKWEQVPI